MTFMAQIFLLHCNDQIKIKEEEGGGGGGGGWILINREYLLSNVQRRFIIAFIIRTKS